MVICLFLGYKGLFLFVVSGVATAVMLRFYKAVLGCITGDMLGAMTEVIETALFLCAGAALF